jgi:DNA primase
VPLYRFVLGNVVSRYDLDRADGRVDAMREAARLVSSIRDRSKVDAFAREIAGMVGVDIDDARAEVRRAANRRPEPVRAAARPDARSDTPEEAPRRQLPDLRDPRFALERETLKLVVQHPQAVGRLAADLGANDFTHPTYRGVWDLVAAAGGPSAAGPGWAVRLRDAATDPEVSSVISALGVEPLHTAKDPDTAFVAAHVFRLQELTAQRRIAELKSRLQRTNPVEHAADYNKMFGQLVALESHRRDLRDRAVGAS